MGKYEYFMSNSEQHRCSDSLIHRWIDSCMDWSQFYEAQIYESKFYESKIDKLKNHLK